MQIKFNTVEEAIEDIKNGKLIIVVDDEDRENEGDFIAAAELVTPEMINFMATHGRGLICAPITKSKSENLDLPLMVNKNTVLHNTQFTVSIDLIGNGCTTGISAQDRSKTIKALTNKNTKADDFGRPGHIFPLIAKEGGVLRRTGHTEASIDFARLAGLESVGILVEILKEDGTMARLPDLMLVAKKFDLKIISIEKLVAYRMQHDSLIEKIEDFKIKTRFGEFRLRAFKQTTNNQVHIALTKGSWKNDESVLVRVNSALINNDIIRLLTKKPDDQFSKIFKMINDQGKGAIVFINQENQSFNLINRLSLIKDAQLEDINKIPKVKLDEKDFGIGAQIIHQLNISKLKLLTNKPNKRIGLIGYGLEVVENISFDDTSNLKIVK
jgi:3,4-dihydroxy 2-butanone 4-phosphate synthase/GTP cyclohydrolase II